MKFGFGNFHGLVKRLHGVKIITPGSGRVFPVDDFIQGDPPRTIELTDQGNWSADENLTDFSLEGNFYSISGELSVNNPENPATISLSYTQAGPDTMYFPFDTDQDGKPNTYVELSVYDSTATILQFSKQ